MSRPNPIHGYFPGETYFVHPFKAHSACGRAIRLYKFEAEGKPITCKVCLRYLKKENPNDQRNVTARGESGATSGPG